MRQGFILFLIPYRSGHYFAFQEFPFHLHSAFPRVFVNFVAPKLCHYEVHLEPKCNSQHEIKRISLEHLIVKKMIKNFETIIANPGAAMLLIKC